jgi:hypothetical protein
MMDGRHHCRAGAGAASSSCVMDGPSSGPTLAALFARTLAGEGSARIPCASRAGKLGCGSAPAETPAGA